EPQRPGRVIEPELHGFLDQRGADARRAARNEIPAELESRVGIVWCRADRRVVHRFRLLDQSSLQERVGHLTLLRNDWRGEQQPGRGETAPQVERRTTCNGASSATSGSSTTFAGADASGTRTAPAAPLDGMVSVVRCCPPAESITAMVSGN